MLQLHLYIHRKKAVECLCCQGFGMLQVVDAMRQTIANYLGGLPPEYFSVEISAKGEDLAQLMYTMMMTGYMFRNVQYKLDLHTNMLPQGQLIVLPPSLPLHPV